MLLWWLGLDTGRETKTCCPGGWASTEGGRPRHVVVVAWPGYREKDQDMLSWWLGQYRGRETKTSCPGGWARIQGERPRHVVLVPWPVDRGTRTCCCSDAGVGADQNMLS